MRLQRVYPTIFGILILKDRFKQIKTIKVDRYLPDSAISFMALSCRMIIKEMQIFIIPAFLEVSNKVLNEVAV
jgi:hypothetical protein